MSSVQERDHQYIAGTYARFPVTLVSGKGSVAYDENGKEYIDMGTGIGVDAFGFVDDTWINAVETQLHKIQHTSNLYYTEPAVELAEILCNKTGMSKVFFVNSGAEANETAIKAARKYQAEHKGPEYSTIITMKDSFHGRTLTTLAATGQEHYHELFQPLTPGFVHSEINNLENVQKLVDEYKVAAIMFECIQGEGGVVNLDKDFVRGLEQIAKDNDLLLIVDEVQTGNGRTGKMYSYMHFDIHPDIVSTAKGLGGGLPIAACLLSEKVQDVFGFGDNGTTYGANPVCCAGAVSVISRIDENLLNGVQERSNYIRNELEGAPGVKGVSGMGLILGVATDRPAGEIVSECLENGVLCLTAKDKIRLLPALNIPMDQLAKAVKVIKEACAKK